MDSSQKAATAIAIFIAIVMLCGGSGLLSYMHGYQRGNEAIYNQGYNQGKEEGYQVGYKSGFEAGYKPATEQETSTGYALHNPTYQEMKTFLAQDTTNSKTYTEDEYVCVDFSAAVNNNAEAEGIRCATVDIFHPEGYGHTIVAFETTDRGLIFIEPQFDREVELVIGKSYSQINNFTPAPRDDTINRFVIIW
jgi:flagellar basal body-associated protein FliL